MSTYHYSQLYSSHTSWWFTSTAITTLITLGLTSQLAHADSPITTLNESTTQTTQIVTIPDSTAIHAQIALTNPTTSLNDKKQNNTEPASTTTPTRSSIKSTVDMPTAPQPHEKNHYITPHSIYGTQHHISFRI